MATTISGSETDDGVEVAVTSDAGGSEHVAEEARPAAGTAVDPEHGSAYQQRLGSRLRSVRRSQGLRLQDVEERSRGRFKAVVVGSYERGDRAVSAQRLAALAAFYEVPVTELLPEEEGPRFHRGELSIAVAVDRLRAREDDPEVLPLLRLVQHVEWLRGDHNGRILSLREDDLRTVAIALGTAPEHLATWLSDRNLLHG